MRAVHWLESRDQSRPVGTRSSGSLANSAPISSSDSPIRWAKTMKAMRRSAARGNRRWPEPARWERISPVPLALLADTDCEDLEAALATNLVGPFRLTKALLGALAAAAREGRPALVINVTSDAAVTPYAGWGAYGASKAGLLHMSRIWDEELRSHDIRVLAIDPGDMDTPLHALAVPDADRTTLKRPAQAAREIVERIAAFARERRTPDETRGQAAPTAA